MLQGQVLDVQLRRMARDEMADHVSMFELFTQVKEVAIGEDNPEGVAYVDNLISLWTKMMLDDAVHDDTIAANVRSMQDATIQQISAMQEGLEKMHAFSLERKTLLETCSQAMHAVIMQEKEMKALTSDLRNKKEDMLCKAKMILKREQDRAGKTIHDCQQSLVRLQDDMNDKIRETEKKLASTEKAKADALAQLATKKTECDEHLDKISKLMRELKARTAELSSCQAELQKASDALEQKVNESEKQSKKAADAKMDFEDLKSKFNTLGAENSKLQSDLQKKTNELQELRNQLLKEQGKAGDLENELNKSSKLVRDAEKAMRCLAVEVRAVQNELSTSKQDMLQIAKNRLVKERKVAVEQVRILQEQISHLKSEMESEVEVIRVENKKLTRSVRTLTQTHEDHRNKIVSKIAYRLLQQCLWKSLTSWQSFTRDTRRLRHKAALVVQRMLNGHIFKSFARWRELYRAHARLNLASKRVLERWINKGLGGSWEKWVSEHVEQKRMKALTKKVIGRWTNQTTLHIFETWSSILTEQKRSTQVIEKVVRRWRDSVLCKALNNWSKKCDENKRFKAAAKKIVLRWTNQVSPLYYIKHRICVVHFVRLATSDDIRFFF